MCLEVYLHHLNYNSVEPGINFPLAATSREVKRDPTALKCLDYISNLGLRNMKLFGVEIFTMLGCYLIPFFLRQVSAFFPLSFPYLLRYIQ